MQDAQALKLQVIQSIDRLPFDNLRLLAEFAAFLEAKSTSFFNRRNISNTNSISESHMTAMSTSLPSSPMRITSPRLVSPAQVADFELEVTMDTVDDSIQQ